MSDFLMNVFGGSKSEQQSQSTSKPVDLTPDAYAGLRAPLATELTKFLGNGGTPQYQGPLTTSLGGNEQTVLDQLMRQTGPNTARGDYLDKTLGGNYLPGQAGSNPFLQASIEAAQRPTFQALEETRGRTLPGRFTQAGQFTQPQGSSAFDRAAAIATRGATQAAADIATNLSSRAYDTERQLQQGAVGLSQAEVDKTVTNLQAQALPRLIQDQGIDRALSLFKERTQSLLDVLKTIAGVAAPTVANEAQSTGTAESTSQKGVFPALFPKGI